MLIPLFLSISDLTGIAEACIVQYSNIALVINLTIVIAISQSSEFNRVAINAPV